MSLFIFRWFLKLNVTTLFSHTYTHTPLSVALAAEENQSISSARKTVTENSLADKAMSLGRKIYKGPRSDDDQLSDRQTSEEGTLHCCFFLVSLFPRFLCFMSLNLFSMASCKPMVTRFALIENHQFNMWIPPTYGGKTNTKATFFRPVFRERWIFKIPTPYTGFGPNLWSYADICCCVGDLL